MSIKRTNKRDIFNIDLSFGSVNIEKKALLAKHLSVMQKSGLTITESISIIMDSSSGKMKKVLSGLLKSVESGNSLSSSMQRYPKIFSELFVSSIYAGENSGTLDENLDNLANQLKKEKDLASKIKGAMMYPFIILIASFVLGMAMSFLVLPKIIPLFKGLKTDLPMTTKWLIDFSNLVEQHGLLLFLSIVAFVMFFMWIVRARFTRPVTHWILLRTPVAKNISYNSNLARFARTLGTLLRSGLTIVQALEITGKTLNNFYYKTALTAVASQVSKGVKLSDSLAQHKNLFPKMTTRMVHVGEESGKLEETLIYLADFYENEVDNATKSLSTAIEPMLLLGIGLIVGFLALSIITPIYNITGNIRR